MTVKYGLKATTGPDPGKIGSGPVVFYTVTGGYPPVTDCYSVIDQFSSSFLRRRAVIIAMADRASSIR